MHDRAHRIWDMSVIISTSVVGVFQGYRKQGMCLLCGYVAWFWFGSAIFDWGARWVGIAQRSASQVTRNWVNEKGQPDHPRMVYRIIYIFRVLIAYHLPCASGYLFSVSIQADNFFLRLQSRPLVGTIAVQRLSVTPLDQELNSEHIMVQSFWSISAPTFFFLRKTDSNSSNYTWIERKKRRWVIRFPEQVERF